MNVNTRNRDISEKHAKVASEIGSEQISESASQLRSRLLKMILESEQNRKSRIPATHFRRL